MSSAPARALRPYQARALQQARRAYAEGARAVLLVAPTGAGKSTLGATAAASALSRGPVAWIAHRRELLDQAADTLAAVGAPPGSVAVTSIQTIVARRQAPEARFVVLDEAHHLGDGVGWSEVARAYLAGGARLLGLTATPARGDGAALSDFDRLVVAAQISELTRAGHLVPLRWLGPRAALRPGQIAQSPADAYARHGEGRSCVVFAPHLMAAELYRAEFAALGVPCAVVDGAQPEKQRAAALAALASGAVRVVVNVGVLTEGFDCPRVSCVIVARGCGSVGLWIQMVGRGLRPSPGKTDCLLLDLRGVAHELGMPDEDREYSLSGDGIRAPEAAPPPETRLCKVCGGPVGEDGRCSVCGHDHGLRAPEVAGVELEHWSARVARRPPEELAKMLARMLRRAREAGHSRGAALHRYRASTGGWPPPAILRAAEAILRDAGAARV